MMRNRFQNVTRSIFLGFPKVSRWVLISTFIVFVIVFYKIDSYSNGELSDILRSFGQENYISLRLIRGASDTDTTTPVNPPGNVVDVEDRKPAFKLVVKDTYTPNVEGTQAQDRVLQQLQLYETCQRDASTIVVDVGSYLGEFGLYAAACGCTVYMFEMQQNIVTLIHSSVDQNYFLPSRVHVYHNAISDVPSDTTVKYTADGSSSFISDSGSSSVQAMRLDDIPWSSSSIFMLHVDVEGYELNVLRSATKLFAENRIHHLMFKYHPWWADRTSQSTLLPYIRNELKARFIYALHRTENIIYGPLRPIDIANYYDQHFKSQYQTDIYAVFVKNVPRSAIKSKPYNSYKPSD
ncbi:unnamed protein product [Adineta steineri]|uniref:Methyltransferase FkbM domain-containing protein n=1 Tax=Adineta steineri TaxID=433720 RepID=A0A813NY68_9BILA|nr:unnamed protein product [Adineta steineri]